MAPAQMALPMDRRNGASAHRAPAPAAPVAVAPVVEPEPVSAKVEGVAPVVAVEAPVPVLVRRTTTGAVLAVALVAAVASYEHMRSLAELAGEGWRSWLLPISVDGLAVAASMTMLVRRRAGLGAGALPWAALLLGLGASLAANVAAAEPTVQGRLVAAWPPVALLLAYELLMQQVKALGGPGLGTGRPGMSNPSDGGS
ncbi:MAG: DUF2637 domain-containing protein [Acidimicrobiales bacterium]